MIQFYTIVLASTLGSLLILPYTIAVSWTSYQTTPVNHLTCRTWRLAGLIAWSLLTVIFTIIMLWSALGLKDAIFSQFGYLC